MCDAKLLTGQRIGDPLADTKTVIGTIFNKASLALISSIGIKAPVAERRLIARHDLGHKHRAAAWAEELPQNDLACGEGFRVGMHTRTGVARRALALHGMGQGVMTILAEARVAMRARDEAVIGKREIVIEMNHDFPFVMRRPRQYDRVANHHGALRLRPRPLSRLFLVSRRRHPKPRAAIP